MNKIIKFIKKKFFEPRKTVIASNELGLEDVKKFLGEEANDLTNEEVQKRFMELPAEKQMEAFFGKNSKNGTQ